MFHAVGHQSQFHKTLLTSRTSGFNLQHLLVTMNHPPFLYFWGFNVAFLCQGFGISWFNLWLLFIFFLGFPEVCPFAIGSQNLEVYVSLRFLDWMVPRHVIALGVDYLFTCLYGCIHPSALIREKFTNSLSTMKFTNFKIYRLDKETMSQCLQECIIFLSPIYPDIEFHTVQRYCKVTNEGPRYNFFGFEEE